MRVGRRARWTGRGGAVAVNPLASLRARIGGGGIAVAAIIAAAVAFVLASMLLDLGPAEVDTAAGSAFSCTVLSVYDGDGPINCAEVDGKGQPVKVRLRGIEAREVDNTCRYPDMCPAATGEEAKAELTRLAVGRLQCRSFGPSYSSVDASCRTPTGDDVSCAMLRSGTAVRWPEYDPDGLLVGCAPRRPAGRGATVAAPGADR